MFSSFVTEWSIQRDDLFNGWFEESVSYLGYSGITEDGETFMSTNGLRSSCLSRGTHVLQARGHIFMSWM